MHVLLLDLLRVLVGVAILSFGATTDWKWRRAPNALWLTMTSIGLAALLVEAYLDHGSWTSRWPYLLGFPVLLLLASDSAIADAIAGALGLGGAIAAFLVARASPDSITSAWPYLAAIPVFVAVIWAFWYFGLIAGGADAKALMALAVLSPYPLAFGDALPLLRSGMPGAFTILTDTLLLFLVIPLSFLAWNVAHGDARLPHAFLGLKREARHAASGHTWPMEVIDAEGKRRTKLFASRMAPSEVEEALARVEALGSERVWVTPKVPFLIPLAAGFVMANVVGDVLFWALAK